MSDADDWMGAVAATALEWRDPDHNPRENAVKRTLEAENTFTREAVTFAVNQQMSLLTVDALRGWLNGRRAKTSRTVGVLNAGNIPMVGLQDLLAVVLAGHRYVGSVSSRSPALLPAFVKDLHDRLPALEAAFDAAEQVFARSDAVIATGSDETIAWVQRQCERYGIPERRRLIRGHSYSVAVLDGSETEDDFEKLAEDALLHEGFGCRNVALIWAPIDMSPDPVLDAFAHFRGVFPAHEGTPGRLAMQQAFLAAVEQPHAYGEGLEFLLSRGEPEEQQSGHVRWCAYDAVEDVDRWLRSHVDEIQLVVAGPNVRPRLSADMRLLPMGEAQRPKLDWCPDGRDTVAFLTERIDD
ncbi:MAG: acyl-CoA reductase [Rhodothermales bacterium]